MPKELLPTYLHDVALVEEIAIDRWRELFDVIGYPGGLNRDELTHESLWRVLLYEQLEPEVVDLVETLYELGSEKGREVLVQAADDLHVERELWPRACAAGELVLHVWLLRAGDERLDEVLSRARLRMFEVSYSAPTPGIRREGGQAHRALLLADERKAPRGGAGVVPRESMWSTPR